MKPDSALRRWSRTVIHFLIVLFTAGQACGAMMLLRLRAPLTLAARSQWLHRWCAVGLRRLEISYTSEGLFPQRGLLVSNHLSYLDILVYSSLTPCVFVAKREIRSWPLFGLMSRLAGTLFIDRERRADTHRVYQEMMNALAAGVVVVLFPEGTSSDGLTILPFRPALFEAALESTEPVSCSHIRYLLEDGSLDQQVCYWGEMTFFPHLIQLLSRREIRARVRFHDQAGRYGSRKEAAQVTHEIVSALAQAANAECPSR